MILPMFLFGVHPTPPLTKILFFSTSCFLLGGESENFVGLAPVGMAKEDANVFDVLAEAKNVVIVRTVWFILRNQPRFVGQML